MLIARFGECEIEIILERDDTGGDQIGRTFNLETDRKIMNEFNVDVELKGNIMVYKERDKAPLDIDAKNSFGFTLGGIFFLLGKDGISKIQNPSHMAELYDVIEALNKMGAEIKIEDKKLITVVEGKELHGVDFTCMYDKHNFITLLSAALCTESEITIENIDFEKMKLGSLDLFLKQSGVKIEFNDKDKTAFIPSQKLSDLKTVDLIASDLPDFVTEWQVLLSPLFSLIKGQSNIVEGYFTNRMRHWEEMKKFGANYEFYTHPDFDEDSDNNPRAVKVNRVEKLKAAIATSRDVKCGAMLLIAGMVAEGESVINDPEDHIKRGYENLAGVLNILGAKIQAL
ncbi:MAG: hypothetical protein Q9M91_02205 [Candidatus Dojkabacteria bacterium]|nr:hypothetical protein [Candidatus Dojkabacteria bacterium]